MSDEFTIGIGTVGAGMWFSYDSGEKWRHIYKFVNPEGNVRAVHVDATDPKRILAASDRTGPLPERGRRLPLVPPQVAHHRGRDLDAAHRPDRSRPHLRRRPARHLALDRPG